MLLATEASHRAEEQDMSHNITSTDNLFVVREPAWHGLGTVLDEYPTRAEAQKLASWILTLK